LFQFPDHTIKTKPRNKLINQLTSLGYDQVVISDETTLLVNIKAQIEKHNYLSPADTECHSTLNHLINGNKFDRAKALEISASSTWTMVILIT